MTLPMPGDDAVGAVQQNRHRPAELPDGTGDLRYVSVAVRPCVARIGDQGLLRGARPPEARCRAASFSWSLWKRQCSFHRWD